MAENRADHPLWESLRAILAVLFEVARYEWHIRSPDDADTSEAPFSVVDLPDPGILKKLADQPGGLKWEPTDYRPTKADLPGPQALINAMEAARQAADPKFRPFRYTLQALHPGGVDLAETVGESWSEWVLTRAIGNFAGFHKRRQKGLPPTVKPDFDRERVEKLLLIEYLDAGAPTDQAPQSEDDGDDPEVVVNDLLARVTMKLSPLQRALFDILWPGAPQEYDQLAHLWSKSPSNEAIRKALDRLNEKLTKHAGAQLYLEFGTNMVHLVKKLRPGRN